VGRGMELEWASRSEPGLDMGPGQVAAPEPHRSPRPNRDAQNAGDRPVHAERIRRSWEAGEYAAMGPVVGLGFAAGRTKLCQWSGKPHS